MSEPAFKPYWAELNLGGYYQDAFSWVFFIVVQVSGRHQPLAIASVKGQDGQSLQGYPLIAACQRLVTIFSTKANHLAVAAEVALARRCHADSKHPIVHLPELDRSNPLDPARYTERDHLRILEFPFISSCLLNALEFDIHHGRFYSNFESLGTVYRDSSTEWGMVAIDITDLSSITYGIVCFKLAPMTYVSSVSEEQRYRMKRNSASIGFMTITEPLRVLDEKRSRSALTARAYLAMCHREEMREGDGTNIRVLDSTQTISSSALDVIWPKTGESAAEQQPIVHDTMVIEAADFAANDGYLRLETARGRSVEQLLSQISTTTCSSLSLCVDDLADDLDGLVNILAESTTITEICFSSNPQRRDDESSIKLYQKLLAMPAILRRVRVTVTGAFSAGLRLHDWLSPALAAGDSETLARTHFDIYPVQQVLFRIASEAGYEASPRWDAKAESSDFYRTYVANSLLLPEAFVSGLIQCLHWLAVSAWFDNAFEDGHLYPFCRFPPANSALEGSQLELSPHLARTSAHNLPDQPLSHVLRSNCWTVLVSRSFYKISGVKPPRNHGYNNQLPIRYAFVRSRGQHMDLLSPSFSQATTADLEVVGVEGFLMLTVPPQRSFDSKTLNQRFDEIANEIKKTVWGRDSLPVQIKPWDVMTGEEALQELRRFIEHVEAGSRN